MNIWRSALGAGCLLAVLLCGCNDRAAPEAAAQPTETRQKLKRRLLPYFENGAPNPADIDDIVECLRIAARFTDEAIIVTSVGHEKIYPEIYSRLGAIRMKLIPGIKIGNILGTRPFHDRAGWAEAAAAVPAFAKAARSDRIFLECEHCLLEYWAHKQDVDPQQLTAALRQLPSGYDYIFYPGSHGGSNQPGIRDLIGPAAVLWAAVQDGLPSVRFTSSVPCYKDADNVWTLRGDALLRKLARKPTLESVYAGPDLLGRDYGGFPFEQIHAGFAKCSGDAYLWAADMKQACRAAADQLGENP